MKLKLNELLNIFYMFIWVSSTRDARCLTLVTNPVINHERGKNQIAITTQIFRNGKPSHVAPIKLSK
jgi:hypothetical protein